MLSCQRCCKTVAMIDVLFASLEAVPFPARMAGDGSARNLRRGFTSFHTGGDGVMDTNR